MIRKRMFTARVKIFKKRVENEEKVKLLEFLFDTFYLLFCIFFVCL